MSANLGEIVSQLNDAIDGMDKAAVAAMRAGKDATEAHQAFKTAGQGSEHPKIRQAITDTAEAAAKADKIARLYAEAGNQFTDYLNLIAPGSAPARKAVGGGSPTGEASVSETDSRTSRGNAFLRKQVKKADDTKDSLENTEKAVTEGIRVIVKGLKPPAGSTSATTTPAAQPPARPRSDAPENPISAVIMAAGALAVGIKAITDQARKRREKGRKEDEDD